MADPGNSDAGRFLQFNFPIRAVKNLPRMILLFAQFHFRIYSARKSDAIFFATELENDVEFELRDHPATHHVRNSALRVLTPRRGGLASVGPRSAIYVGSARRGAGIPEAARAQVSLAMLLALGEALACHQTNPQGVSARPACQNPPIGADLPQNMTPSGECQVMMI